MIVPPIAETQVTFTDVATGNESTTKHGYAPKATAPGAGLLNVLGIGNGETAHTDKAIFDNTNPESLGTVGPGIALIAARRDHVHPLTGQLVATFDGGGSAVATGLKYGFRIPFACTLTGWTMATDQVTGGTALVVDVWKDTYANYPPTNADAMPGAGKEPTVASGALKGTDTDIADWTTVAVAAGDWLYFNVDTTSTVTWAQLCLTYTRT